MARAAFLMDRVMRACGLSGQSFIPMLSSFACAVPGIMATRVIPSRRDRLATILAAPFMTCSARLPVYALLIAAVIPDRGVLGFLNLQGVVLLGLYLLGIVMGIVTAFALKKTLLRGPTPSFVMEMPPYRWPSLRTTLLRLWNRAWVFISRAGTVIFAVTVVVWALAYFPRSADVEQRFDELRGAARAELSGEALAEHLDTLDRRQAAAQLEASALGRIGQAIEPIFRPLGWDWRVSSAVLASFPAREVVVAALGTIFAVGADVDESHEGLLARISNATWPDGDPLFTLPMALGLMVFFALCLQCGATVATIRREAGGWSWAVLAWTYMTVVAWLGAFLTYRIGLGVG
jgi:ferrous iron transport protein B